MTIAKLSKTCIGCGCPAASQMNYRRTLYEAYEPYEGDAPKQIMYIFPLCADCMRLDKAALKARSLVHHKFAEGALYWSRN